MRIEKHVIMLCYFFSSVGRFSVGGGELYCMTHYKQAFREKGTYDVFTPDNPIKGKWQSKPAE